MKYTRNILRNGKGFVFEGDFVILIGVICIEIFIKNLGIFWQTRKF